MGCDVYWKAIEPNQAQQRLAGWLVHSIATKNCWDHRVFNGPIHGCFLYEPDLPNDSLVDLLNAKINCQPLTAMRTTLVLIGVTLFYEQAVDLRNRDDDKDSFDVARRQCSFVFSNTPALPASRAYELVTIEFVDDLARARYADYRCAFEALASNPATEPCAILRPGSWDRMMNEVAPRALSLALSVKQQCLPNLTAGDDYGNFSDMLEAEAPIREGFLLSTADPALRSFWGV